MRLILALVLCTRASSEGQNVAKEDPDARIVAPKSSLDDLAYEVAQSAIRARSTAADARSVGSEAQARISAANTEVSQHTAEQLAAWAPLEEPFLKNAEREAKKQSALAATAAVASESGYNTAVLRQKEDIANAAAWASQEVQNKLADTYVKLQDWKMEVLHDPVSEAKIAANKAARPWENAVRTLHQRIVEYEQRAETLNNQAYTLQSIAAVTANVAVGTMGLGLTKAGVAQMKSAHHMMNQAQIFGKQAFKLIEQANLLNLNFQAYQAGQQAATAAAAHRYAPHLFVPAPTDLAAWAPPGPPLPYNNPAATTFVQASAHDVRTDKTLAKKLLLSAKNALQHAPKASVEAAKEVQAKHHSDTRKLVHDDD